MLQQVIQLYLNLGNYIPADCRLIESFNLKVDESILTGETVPVLKDANATNFVGLQFKVKSTTLNENDYYQLYSTNDTAQPIFVKIQTSTADEVKEYNATLAGAVSTSTAKPAQKHYKVIKVVN